MRLVHAPLLASLHRLSNDLAASCFQRKQKAGSLHASLFHLEAARNRRPLLDPGSEPSPPRPWYLCSLSFSPIKFSSSNTPHLPFLVGDALFSFCRPLFFSYLCLFLYIYHTHNIREGMLHRKPCLLSQLRHAQPTRKVPSTISSSMSVDSGPFEWMMRRRGLSKTGEFGTCQM